jgi:hypothetical protein
LVKNQVSSGASSTAQIVAAARSMVMAVSRRWVNASPPSASVLRALTITGTRTLVKMPPSSSS